MHTAYWTAYLKSPPNFQYPTSDTFQSSTTKYNLYAVLVHAGSSAQCGHYYCFVKSASGNVLCHLTCTRFSVYRQNSEAGNLDQSDILETMLTIF